jgi:hypothetical protein
MFILVHSSGAVLLGVAGGLSEERADALRFDTEQDANDAMDDLSRWEPGVVYFIDELTEEDIPEGETEMTKDVICPRCGGQGGCPGSDFGDHGWHPCFLCCEEGYITQDQMAIFESNEARLQEEAMYSGYSPEWDGGPGDYWTEEDDIRAQEQLEDWINPDRVWVGEDISECQPPDDVPLDFGGYRVESDGRNPRWVIPTKPWPNIDDIPF